jgi:hypothetical protein
MRANMIGDIVRGQLSFRQQETERKENEGKEIGAKLADIVINIFKNLLLFIEEEIKKQIIEERWRVNGKILCVAFPLVNLKISIDGLCPSFSENRQAKLFEYVVSMIYENRFSIHGAIKWIYLDLDIDGVVFRSAHKAFEESISAQYYEYKIQTIIADYLHDSFKEKEPFLTKVVCNILGLTSDEDEIESGNRNILSFEFSFEFDQEEHKKQKTPSLDPE